MTAAVVSSVRVCRHVPCTRILPPREPGRPGRPRLYCSPEHRWAHHAAVAGGYVLLEAVGDDGRVLDEHVADRPLDPDAWADALALVTAALTGARAHGRASTTDRLASSCEVDPRGARADGG